MGKRPILQLEDISAGYEGKTVLSHIDLTVYEKDFLGIIGPNGGGKTTLIKVMLGLLAPQSGRIRAFRDGQEVRSISIGYLPQYSYIDRQFPISVRETVLSGLHRQKGLWGRFTAQHHEQTQRIIERMGLEGLEERSIGQLSGGQLQRVLLGRALVSQPQAIVLDEPDTYIDKRFEAKLYELLTEINRECAVILVSHDIGTVMQNVKSIACVEGTLHYHPDAELPQEWIEEHMGCPVEIVGHGRFPHRVLHEHGNCCGDKHSEE